MSITHNDLRSMLNHDRRAHFCGFYGGCEIVATAALLVGWAVAIISHL